MVKTTRDKACMTLVMEQKQVYRYVSQCRHDSYAHPIVNYMYWDI